MSGCAQRCAPFGNTWKKTMSDVRGIVIGHGQMAFGIVDAVRQIADAAGRGTPLSIDAGASTELAHRDGVGTH